MEGALRGRVARHENKLTMRDNQNLMIEFVNIIKKYPEIYDATLDTYRTRFSEMAWLKVANQVKSELKEECTLEELKLKWKGIRSSYNRYRSRINLTQNDSTCKKYYLYDHLTFLEPFLKCNLKASGQDQDKSETSISDPCNFVNADGMETNEYCVDEWNQIEIKPDLTGKPDPEATSSTEPYFGTKKRKFSSEGASNEDDNEDLAFFKSILPDIRNFTIKEKRRLKMGILQLIDDIEKEKET
ncbi:hypothetical protein PYW08_001703 [Mythimna loreyi]|uniref:Uncharacterized protein n=1 Tax=Mythimna loreyi TaxID=667449 RepID=A0ACC2R5M5_9NEOP|nr:hypothetical protein PYW08_001703 [Mythimna loreyi]